MDNITEPSVPSSQHNWRNILEFVGELVKIAIISTAIIIPVRLFLIQPFYVKGASMEPNFYNHEYLIINEIGYRLAAPTRGDIVVFRYPKDPSQFFIKRIIGLPGERVVINNGQITIFRPGDIDGLVLDESEYLADDVVTNGAVNTLLSPEQYFVMGDNRRSSLDSRSFGPISQTDIVGKAWVRGWPFDKITVFDSPIYNF